MTRDTLLQMLLKTSPDIYAQGDATTEHQPMAFTWTPPAPQGPAGGALDVVALVMSKEYIPTAFADFVRNGATVVAYVGEAWTPATLRTRAQVEALAAAGGVTTLPPDDRREVLTITAADRDGITMATRTLTRPREGRVTLGPVRINECADHRFFRRLPWPAPGGGRP